MVKSIRIDGLPEDVQRKIIALRDHATGGGPGIITAQQVERALSIVEAGRLPATDGTWAASNGATALGRMALHFFAENPTAAKQFKNYLGRLQASGRIIAHAGGRKRANGEMTTA